MIGSTAWIITTSDERPISAIALDLTRAGFSVGSVLEEIGSITGTADPQLLAKLRTIAGVIDVAPELGFDIGPPDAPIA